MLRMFNGRPHDCRPRQRAGTRPNVTNILVITCEHPHRGAIDVGAGLVPGPSVYASCKRPGEKGTIISPRPAQRLPANPGGQVLGQKWGLPWAAAMPAPLLERNLTRPAPTPPAYLAKSSWHWAQGPRPTVFIEADPKTSCYLSPLCTARSTKPLPCR